MNQWIIYLPILVGVVTLGLGIWNARTSAKKVEVDVKTSATDEYTKALNGRITVMAENIADLDKRMIACELARAELAKQNVDLQREKIDLLTQLVSAGVVASINKKA